VVELIRRLEASRLAPEGSGADRGYGTFMRAHGRHALCLSGRLRTASVAASTVRSGAGRDRRGDDADMQSTTASEKRDPLAESHTPGRSQNAVIGARGAARARAAYVGGLARLGDAYLSVVTIVEGIARLYRLEEKPAS